MDPLFPLAALALGSAVGFALAGFRDPKADEHDLSDYHEPTPVRLRVPTTDRNPSLDTHLIWDDERATADDILPPAPPGMNAGSPLYRALVAEQVVAEQLRERWGTTNPDAIADLMLRESAVEALAGAR